MTVADVLFVIDSTGSMWKVIKAAHDKVEDIAAELRISHRKINFMWGCVCYRDKVADPEDENEIFEFDSESENLSLFLDKIEAHGGGKDGPEDWVGALNDAFNLKWRNGKKIIIWLADYPAHGIRFAGRDKFPAEEAKLVPLVEKLATDGYYFTGIAIKPYANKTFEQMRQIYQENGGKKFTIEEFKVDEDINLDEMLTRTSVSAVSDALFDD